MDELIPVLAIDEDFHKSHPAYEYQVINRIWNDFFHSDKKKDKGVLN